jgi:hypothetical protein
MERILRKHDATFRCHPRGRSHYLGTAGITHLRAGRWAPALRATARAFVVDPRRRKAVPQLALGLAGPKALALWHRARS